MQTAVVWLAYSANKSYTFGFSNFLAHSCMSTSSQCTFTVVAFLFLLWCGCKCFVSANLKFFIDAVQPLSIF